MTHPAHTHAHRSFYRVTLAVLLSALFLPPVGCNSRTTRTAPRSATLTDATGPIAAEFTDDKVIIEAMINGTGPHRLLLDTGYTTSSIAPEIAARIGISPYASIRSVDAHGNRGSSPLARADTVRLGGLELRGVPIKIDTLPPLITEGSGLVGVAGYNLFGAYTLDIDYPNHTVKVTDERLPIDGTLPLSLDGGRNPFVLAEFRLPGDTDSHEDGIHETEMLVDTGSQAQLSLSGLRVSLYADHEQAAQGGAVMSANGDIRPAMFARLEYDLFLGAPTATRVTALIEKQSAYYFSGAAELGAALMRHFRVTLDPVNKRARFLAPEGEPFVEMPVHRIHGFTAERIDEQTIAVESVIDGSPAQSAGLRAGDRVLSIDDRAPGEMIGPIQDPSVVDRRFVIERDGERIELRIGLQQLIPEPDNYQMMRERSPKANPAR